MLILLISTKSLLGFKFIFDELVFFKYQIGILLEYSVKQNIAWDF